MDMDFVMQPYSPRVGGPPFFATPSRRALLVLTATLFLWPKYIVFLPSVSPYTIMVFICIGLSFGIIAFSRKATASLSYLSKIAIFVLFLFFIVRISSDIASDTIASSLYFDFRDLIFGGSLFFIAAMTVRSPATLREIARLACWSAIAISIAALIEQSTLTTLPALILQNIPIPIDEQFQQMLTADKSRGGAFRSQAFFSHPIVMGLVSASIFPIAISTWLNGQRILSFAAMVACIAAIILSGARSAQLALLAAVICHVLLLVVLSRSRFVLSWAALLLPLAVLSVPPIVYAVGELVVGRSSVEQRSSDMRALMWERGEPEIAKSPIIGHGGGNSAPIAGIRARFGATYTIDDYYLSIILDSGYLGVALLAAFVFSVALITLRSDGPSDERRLRAAFFSGLIAILLGQKATSITEGMAFFYFYAGIIVSSNKKSDFFQHNAISRA